MTKRVIVLDEVQFGTLLSFLSSIKMHHPHLMMGDGHPMVQVVKQIEASPLLAEDISNLIER